MSKIVFIIGGLRSGGAEKVCISLLNEFYSQGQDVSLIVLNLKQEQLLKYLDPNIPLYDLNTNRAMYAFLPLAGLLRKLNADCYLSFNFHLSVQLIVIRKILGLRFLIYSRGLNTFSQKVINETSFRHRYLNAFLIRWLYKKSDYFIAQSTGMKSDMIRSLGITDEKIKIIFNPVYMFGDSKEFEKNVIDEKKKREILFIGTLRHQKNLPFLFGAIKELSFLRSDFIFKVVGEGELKHSLREAVSDMGISQYVSFEGFSTTPSVYYRNADVFILGSWYEGFPNVLVEAISYGTPVVSINCMSGPSDIIKSGINGYLVEQYDTQIFASKIALALDRMWNMEVLASSIKDFEFNKIFNQYKDYLNLNVLDRK